mgnify:CR=1 FL=1
MRTIRTFILRLLVNSAEPEALRGDLRPMPEGEPMPFADEQALLALLRRLVVESPRQARGKVDNEQVSRRKEMLK